MIIIIVRQGHFNSTRPSAARPINIYTIINVSRALCTTTTDRCGLFLLIRFLSSLSGFVWVTDENAAKLQIIGAHAAIEGGVG